MPEDRTQFEPGYGSYDYRIIWRDGKPLVQTTCLRENADGTISPMTLDVDQLNVLIARETLEGNANSATLLTDMRDALKSQIPVPGGPDLSCCG